MTVFDICDKENDAVCGRMVGDTITSWIWNASGSLRRVHALVVENGAVSLAIGVEID